MKKAKKQMSWKEVFQMNIRGLKIFYEHYPQIVVSRIISVIWNALTPYVGIFLSALVIDELVGNRDIKRLQTLVIITLVSAAIIALGTALLHKWKETQGTGFWYKVEHIVSEKMLDTDYANLDDTHTAEMLSTIRQNYNGGGWGLERVMACCEEICSAILTILGGLALTVTLFVSKVPTDAGDLTTLNNPLVVLGIIVVLLFGPLYHLHEEADKLRCIEEAKRVCKPDGKIFFAFISNDMVILTMQQCQEDYLMNGDYNKETFRLDDFPFVFHTPERCRELLGKARIQIIHEVASDGASELLQDLVNGLDKASYQQYLRYHFYICEKPEFLGMSNHLLFVGHK